LDQIKTKVFQQWEFIQNKESFYKDKNLTTTFKKKFLKF